MFSLLRRNKSGSVVEEAPPKPSKSLSPVEKMADAARKPVPQPSELAELKGREVTLRNIIGTMLGVEAGAKAEVEQKHAVVEKRIAQLEMIPKVIEATGGAYKILDMEPLKLRSWENPALPVLAVFSLDDQTFRLNVNLTALNYRHGSQDGRRLMWRDYKQERTIKPSMPEDISVMFHDVLDALYEQGTKELPWFDSVKSHSDDFHVTATFKGAIPADVKEEIEKAKQSGVFKQIFLVAETEMKQGSDPLVVGWDGANHWLIKPFATTSVEQMMADKFTTKP